MLNIKICTLIALLLSVALSKPVYVFDNAMEFSKFMSDSPESGLFDRALSEVNGETSDVEDLKGTMKVESCPGSFTCEWTCGFFGDVPEESAQACPEIKSDPKHPVKEGDYVKTIKDLSTRSVYCLVNYNSRHVLSLNSKNNLKQTDSSDCDDASRFMFKTLDYEINYDHAIGRIYSEESFNFLQPRNARRHTMNIIGKPLNMKDDAQKWKISKSDFTTEEATWFHLQNVVKDYAFDVKQGITTAADIITYPLHRGGNQAFGFKVVENL